MPKPQTNYTPEVLATIHEYWTTSLDPKPQELSAILELPIKSVVAKLAQLGLYKKAEYKNKLGLVPKNKDQLVDELSQLLHTPAEQLESLTKANKRVLELLIKHLQ